MKIYYPKFFKTAYEKKFLMNGPYFNSIENGDLYRLTMRAALSIHELKLMLGSASEFITLEKSIEQEIYKVLNCEENLCHTEVVPSLDSSYSSLASKIADKSFFTHPSKTEIALETFLVIAGVVSTIGSIFFAAPSLLLGGFIAIVAGYDVDVKNRILNNGQLNDIKSLIDKLALLQSSEESNVAALDLATST